MRVVLGLTVLFLMLTFFGFAGGVYTPPISLRQPRQIAVKARVIVGKAEVEEQCHRQAKGGDPTDLQERECMLPEGGWLLNHIRSAYVITTTTVRVLLPTL